MFSCAEEKMMDKWTEIAWNVFAKTGDICSYLNYKENFLPTGRSEEQTQAAWSGKREEAVLR